MAGAGWNLLLLVKRLMREGALASASAPSALLRALWGPQSAPGRLWVAFGGRQQSKRQKWQEAGSELHRSLSSRIRRPQHPFIRGLLVLQRWFW